MSGNRKRFGDSSGGESDGYGSGGSGLNAKQAAKFIAEKFSLDDAKRDLLENIIGGCCEEDPVLIVVSNNNWLGQWYNGQQNTPNDRIAVLNAIGTYNDVGKNTYNTNNRRDQSAPHLAYHFRDRSEIEACHAQILQQYPQAFAHGVNPAGLNPAVPLAKTIVVNKTSSAKSDISNYQFFHL